MTNDYLTIKSLFYDDKSILEGMEALRSVDEKLQRSTAHAIWISYAGNTHGNHQQISLELAQNRDLIEGLDPYDKELLLVTFRRKIEQMNSYTDLKNGNQSQKNPESVLQDGTFENSGEKLNLIQIKDKSTHLAVIDRVLNSDGNDKKKTDLRNVVLGFLPKTVEYISKEWHTNDSMRYNLDGRNAHLYIINMICEGEEFPEYYIDKVLTTSGKTKLFDKSTTWKKSYNQQNPLHVAWLLSTWKQQTIIERTILHAGEIHHEDAVEKFRTMVLQSHAHYLDKSKFVQENHSSILSNLMTIERFLDPDFDVDFTTDEGLCDVHELAKAIKELLDTYSKDDLMCNLLKTIQGPKDPTTFGQRSLPDVGNDNQKRILEALRSNPSGLTSNELRQQASLTRVRLSSAIKSYIDNVDDRYTLRDEFLPPFKGLSVYIHEKLTNKSFVQHILDHIETLEPSTHNFDLYIEILEHHDLFLEHQSEYNKSTYLLNIREKNFRLLFMNFKDYLTKANDSPEERQKLDRITMFKQILWVEHPFGLRWPEKDTYHKHMLVWTQCCIEMNLDKKLAQIDFPTYEKLKWDRKGGEASFKEYSSNYLSKVARFLLDQ